MCRSVGPTGREGRRLVSLKVWDGALEQN